MKSKLADITVIVLLTVTLYLIAGTEIITKEWVWVLGPALLSMSFLGKYIGKLTEKKL